MFKAGGDVVIKTGNEKKVENAKYRIEGNKIVFLDKKSGEPEVYLSNIKLTKKELSGDLVPAGNDKMPPGFELKLHLRRK